ncbi:MAG TPA: glycosyltransferase [Bryobacteraceae bacterium]|nr:glycosyltransferase [Bryobacteraceae bacterium]
MPGIQAMKLSVVVTVVDGGDVLRRFLRALTNQEDAPEMEILVPFDASKAGVAKVCAEFPTVTPVPMGEVETFRPLTTAAGQHEMFDRQRVAGLNRAGGELIAILEDRAPPRPNWVRTAVRLHQTLPYGVIGGAIECAPQKLLNWSFYVCDFTRYGLPFESAPRAWISDINVCYKRKMMDDTREIWRERFNEAKVHWTLAERGETLFLSSELVVDYHTPYQSLFDVLPERIGWGRLYGSVLATSVPPVRRLILIALAPLIPVRLLLRHGLAQAKRGNLGKYIKASPIIALLLTFWTLGETWGNITGKP